MNRKDNVIEFDLMDILRTLRDNLLIIILVVSIFGGSAAAYSWFVLVPLYETSATLYVLPDDNSLDEKTSASDLSLGQSLIADAMEVITSRAVMERTCKYLKLDIDYTSLKNSVSVENKEGTRMITITVTGTDPKDIARKANGIAKVSRIAIAKTMKTDIPSIMETARVNTNPIGPNKSKNIAIGVILGLILSIGGSIITSIMNDTIKGKDEVEKHLDLFVLAQVPFVEDIEIQDDKAPKDGKNRR